MRRVDVFGGAASGQVSQLPIPPKNPPFIPRVLICSGSQLTVKCGPSFPGAHNTALISSGRRQACVGTERHPTMHFTCTSPAPAAVMTAGTGNTPGVPTCETVPRSSLCALVEAANAPPPPPSDFFLRGCLKAEGDKV